MRILLYNCTLLNIYQADAFVAEADSLPECLAAVQWELLIGFECTFISHGCIIQFAITTEEK